ncbi:MAG TPA: hypothetical protein VHY82_06640 [Acetobacteraceae bacterium]|nr:hypothetical protein [Acetobacteraceae bacterium]
MCGEFVDSPSTNFPRGQRIGGANAGLDASGTVPEIAAIALNAVSVKLSDVEGRPF